MSTVHTHDGIAYPAVIRRGSGLPFLWHDGMRWCLGKSLPTEIVRQLPPQVARACEIHARLAKSSQV